MHVLAVLPYLLLWWDSHTTSVGLSLGASMCLSTTFCWFSHDFGKQCWFCWAALCPTCSCALLHGNLINCAGGNGVAWFLSRRAHHSWTASNVSKTGGLTLSYIFSYTYCLKVFKLSSAFIEEVDVMIYCLCLKKNALHLVFLSVKVCIWNEGDRV